MAPGTPLQYVLALLPFQAPGWAPASPSGSGSSGSGSGSGSGLGLGAAAGASTKSDPLVSLPVTLASVNAAGVVPRSYAPPGYAEKLEADYNTTIGYLENGNQRCVCWSRPRCRMLSVEFRVSMAGAVMLFRDT